jgi:hypothetical protein
MNGDRSTLRYRLLRSWALQSRKAQRFLRQVESAIEVWTGSLLSKTLRDEEKEVLSVDLYDASFRPENDHDGLYPWETQWFERRLPPAPASVLVGAAGAGREAVALQRLGYAVHAFEPSASAFEVCRMSLGSEHVDRASYRDLVATALNDRSTRLRIEGGKRFDAVLLGWGSFGHVLRHSDRFELLRACDRIAPEGPILLSIFEPSETGVSAKTYYTPWGGFLARLTFEELERHAQALDRKLTVSLGSPTSYATLTPIAQ